MTMLIVCCFIALLYPVVGTTRYRLYIKTHVSTENGTVSELEATTQIHCAAICLDSGSCKSFQFNKTTNKCRMSSVTLASPDNRGTVYSVVADDCPTNQGYSKWIFSDMELCLKYYSTEMNHTVAKSTCGKDGAHLVLIERLAVRIRINEALTTLGVTSPIWLDGYDESGANLFLSWKGKPLAWIEWGKDNPDDTGDDDCLVGRSPDGYKHRDYSCSNEKAVLCQIDIM